MGAISKFSSLCAVGLCVVSGNAFAADGSSGCGVGWYLFKENSLVSSSLRQTTHAYLPNTFSMTSGTSNCAKHSIIYNEKKGLHFVESNSDALELAIASGEGQFLQGFAESMGCNQNVANEFAATLQESYVEIYSQEAHSQSLDKSEVYNKIRSALGKNSLLRNQCALVGQNT